MVFCGGCPGYNDGGRGGRGPAEPDAPGRGPATAGGAADRAEPAPSGGEHILLGRRDFLRAGLAASAGALLGGGCGGPPDEGAGRDTRRADPDALRARLASEALRVFRANRVEAEQGVFHLPSAATYRSFFAWDSGWNVMGLAPLDPESALAELQTVFRMQCQDGRVPHEVRIPGLRETDPLRILTLLVVRRQYDERGRSRFIDPPSFLLAAEVLYRRTGDPRILDLLPAMERCVDYLLGARDLFGDGLVSIIHPWESGTDSAPVFDEPMGLDVENPLVILDYLTLYPALLHFCADLGWDPAALADADRFVFEDVGVNAVTAAGLLSMAALWREAGAPDRARRCRRRAEAMVRAMERFLWDEDAGFFFPRFHRRAPRKARRRSLTGVAPLITGLVEDRKALRVIRGALQDADHFLGPWKVPFNSISETEERIPFEDRLLWRGHCVWANMNWIAARAAAAYGQADLAREITRATAALVDREGFREFYDSRTGLGAGAPGFTWPALVLDMIGQHGL